MQSRSQVKIHLFTGKGGVGKSAIAAAYAFKLAKKKEKTLLVELGNQSFYKDYFSLKAVEYFPHNLATNLDISIWKGQDCLREYALYLLKIEALYKLFFENPVTRTLINIAPALSELAIMGKITSGPPRNVGPKLDYDHIVIDAYSTGHFLALLRAPKGMADAFRIGPMAEQSRGILKILTDPQIVDYWIVTLPEEMPTQETLELYSKIKNETGISPHIILNKIYENIVEPSSTANGTPEFKDFLSIQLQRQNTSLLQLKELSVNRIPIFFEQDSFALVQKISESKGWLE
jgi:cellulose biosynthesis protein BcsQ